MTPTASATTATQLSADEVEKRKQEAVDRRFATCVGPRCDGDCTVFLPDDAHDACAGCGDRLLQHRHCKAEYTLGGAANLAVLKTRLKVASAAEPAALKDKLNPQAPLSEEQKSADSTNAKAKAHDGINAAETVELTAVFLPEGATGLCALCGDTLTLLQHGCKVASAAEPAALKDKLNPQAPLSEEQKSADSTNAKAKAHDGINAAETVELTAEAARLAESVLEDLAGSISVVTAAFRTQLDGAESYGDGTWLEEETATIACKLRGILVDAVADAVDARAPKGFDRSALAGALALALPTTGSSS